MKKFFLLSLGMIILFTFTACNNPKDLEPIPLPFSYDTRSLVTTECQEIENIGEWQPIWCEEFDYTGLPNEDKWSFEYGGYWYNNEVQFYTNKDIDNAYVDNGFLFITALKETFENRNYTSARIVSKNKGDFTYGRIRIRAILPSGNGTWPALWMLPTSSVYGGWPNSGEIDIMEYVGKDPMTIHGTLHSGAYNHTIGTQVSYTTKVDTAETEFHVYEIIWKPGIMYIYVDDHIYGTFEYIAEDNVNISNSDAWPFDQDFYIIMNLALGGWGGDIDDNIFPQTMKIDYIRVYNKDYAGMDQEYPSDVNEIILQNSTQNSLKIMWNKAIDDIMIKEYLIYVNNVFIGKTSVNAYLIEGLESKTLYNISIIAVDFAGNQSNMVINTIKTD